MKINWNKMKKKGDVKLSFGMLFSIILIIIFLAFTFYAIKKFLGTAESVQVGRFLDSFQKDVNKVYGLSKGADTQEYSLPGKIEAVCFFDPGERPISNQKIYDEILEVHYGNQNLFFYPIGSGGDLSSKEIKHINMTKTLDRGNPLCIKNENKVNLIIKKEFGENYVTIIEK